ncbi:MAG: hypothetical protein V4717_15575 [Bacteroidota bacterium]
MGEKRVNDIFQAIILFFLIPNKLFIPPRHAIDSAWQIAVNNAFTSGYHFGTELVFTYGPLGFLSYGLPLGLGIWATGIVLYKLAIITGLFVIGRKALLGQHQIFGKVIVLLAFVFCGRFFIFDPTIFVLLFITLGCINSLEQPNIPWLFLLGLVAVLGFFIKMNSGFTGFLFVGITMLFLFFRKKISAKQFFGVVGINLLLLVLLCFVLRVDLLSYIRHGLTIVNYYNDAMAVPLPAWPVTPLAVVGLGLLLVVLFLAAFKQTRDKLQWSVAFCMAATFFFIAFKQGFVVAVGNHQLIFFSVMPFLFLGLDGTATIPVTQETRDTISWLAVFFTICAIFNIGHMTFHSRWLRDLYMKEPVIQMEIPAAINKRIGNKTVDIFPSDIDRLYFEKLHFTTRPVPQGYSVYHSSLDAANASFYRSGKSPQFVVMGIGSIPGRHPFWDETNTRIAVRNNYHLVDSFRFTNEVLAPALSHFYLLEKNASTTQSQLKMLSNHKAFLNKKIAIPDSEFPVLLKVKAQYSGWNKIKRFLFQPTLLKCRINYEDGSYSEHNAILPTIENGVIINKKFLSNEEASWFFGVKREMVKAKEIIFRGDAFWFEEEIDISFFEVN